MASAMRQPYIEPAEYLAHERHSDVKYAGVRLANEAAGDVAAGPPRP